MDVPAMDTEKIQNALEFAHTLNNLKPYVFWGILMFAFAIIGYHLVILYFKNLREDRMDKRKELRAASYNETLLSVKRSLDNQGLAFNQLSEGLRPSLSALIESSERTAVAVLSLETSVSGMKDRIDERMTFEDTLELVRLVYHRIESFCVTEIARSLRQNNYSTNAETISARVRTDIAAVIEKHRSDLRGMKTNFDTGVFFRVYLRDLDLRQQRYVSRYELCDQVWAAAEPLFLDHNTPLEDRLQRLSVRLRNLFTDEYSNLVELVSQRQRAGRRPDQETASRETVLYSRHDTPVETQ